MAEKTGGRVLCADIGNTSVKLGLYENGVLRFHSSLKTVTDTGADEYAVRIAGVFALYGERTAVDGVIVSSVVPSVTDYIIGAARRLFSVGAVCVGPGVRTGLDIRVDNAVSIGADIVADTVGAFALAKAPLVVVDFGTATTLAAVNCAGVLCGVAILPGIRVSLSSLSEHAAELTDVSLKLPKTLLGKNTADSMICGVLWSAAFAADGYIEALARAEGTTVMPPDMPRILSDGEKTPLSAVVTGGLSPLAAPLMKNATIVSPTLVLDGLYAIWQKNFKARA